MDAAIDGPDGTIEQYNRQSSNGTPTEPRSRRGRRLRVSRACDRCKKRKMRCSGTQPCDTCSRDETNCVYAAPYNRGRRPDIQVVDGLGLMQNNLEGPLASGPTHDLCAEVHAAHHRPRLATGKDAADFVDLPVVEPLSRASPDPVTDLQGYYLGPASGVSFLARVRKRLQYGELASSMFTFGDAPLPDHDSMPSVMISREESSRLVKKFFEFTVPIDRIVHQGTVEEWLSEFQDTLGAMRDPENAPARRAMIWMIFAMAQEHMPSETTCGTSDDRSVRYFLAADCQLDKERGTISLTSVQARLYQCFWLLSRSRVNHCWTLFGSTARVALALGLHRKRLAAHLNCDGSTLSLDLCRRTFWSAYYLDVHLSLTLGRPRIFHDEDIDQELPNGLEYDEVPVDQLTSSNSHSFSTMLAPVAYYQLHRILSSILRDVYSIRSLSTGELHDAAQTYSHDLKCWRNSLPDFLQVDSKVAPPLIPIFQRQRDVLNFTYWHALIVNFRPMMLKSFARLDIHSTDALHQSQIESSVNECLHAAVCIIERVCQMFESRRMLRSFWATCYYGFSAAAILYVYTIQQTSLGSATYQTFLDSATRCHDQLARFTESGSLVARYCLVLDELRFDTLRQFEENPRSELTATVSSTMAAPRMDDALAAEYANILGASMPFADPNVDEMGRAPADFATWLHFEPLVRSLFQFSSDPT